MLCHNVLEKINLKDVLKDVVKEGNNLELVKKRVKSLKNPTMGRYESKHEAMSLAKEATLLVQREYTPHGLNTLLP